LVKADSFFIDGMGQHGPDPGMFDNQHRAVAGVDYPELRL
jgi:hypothetical protein